jgi:hypothetical protein
MTTILSAFNNHFLEFVQDILTIFPDNHDLKKAKAGLEMLKKANPRIIIQFWKTYIVEHYDNQIENGDISFFLDKDYTKDIQNNGADNKILTSIEKIRAPIKDMGKENQAKCMEYIQNLTKISKMY